MDLKTGEVDLETEEVDLESGQVGIDQGELFFCSECVRQVFLPIYV